MTTKLGVKFTNLDLLTQALTHRSCLNENAKVTVSNERLEFLGDSVLSLLTSQELFARFPAYPEGKLTNMRSALVRTQTLAKIAKSLDLGESLLMSKGEERSGGRKNVSILADAFEAILGAVFLDSGLESAKSLLKKHLFPLIDSIQIYDFKSKLQEVVQEQEKVAPTYQVVKETGPDHDKLFTVVVFAGKKELGQGGGKSKQEAEQDAARIALETLK